MGETEMEPLVVTPRPCSVTGRPMPPEEWFKAAIDEARHWTLPGLCEADDESCGYPLIDALSNNGKGATVKEGIERAEELATDITLAIWNAALALAKEGG